MNTYLNVHEVERVEVLRMEHKSTSSYSLTITVVSNDGDEIEFVLFSKQPLKLEEVEL